MSTGRGARNRLGGKPGREHQKRQARGGGHAPWTDRFAPANGLVIELIGPPACGKTTLALATAAELERRDIAVHLAISARPHEASGTQGPACASRFVKLADALSQAMRRDPVARQLLELMPVQGPLTYLRRRRYIANLARIGPPSGLLVQDQGYLCAIAGLALDSGRVDARALDQALALVPLPQVVVRVIVSEEVTAARLAQRHYHMTRAEQVLERKPTENRGLEKVFDTIDTALGKQGRCILRVSGHDQVCLQAAVSSIIAAILALRAPFPDGTVHS